MPATPYPLINGDSIAEADYRSKLPVNMYAVERDIRGAKGYLINHPGLTNHATGIGVDRGAKFTTAPNFKSHYRVSGERLIEIDASGNVTNLSGDVGDDNYVPITGSGLVEMAQSNNNLAIVNGTDVWYYNPTKGLRRIDVDLPDEETPPTSGQLTYSFTGDSTSYQADRTAAGFDSISTNFNGIFQNIATYGYLQDDQEPEQTPPQGGQSLFKFIGSSTVYQSVRQASGFDAVDTNFNGAFQNLGTYGYIQDSIWNKFGTAGHTQTGDRLAVYYKQVEGQDDVALIVRYVVGDPQWFIFSDSSLTGPEVFTDNDTFDFSTFDTSTDYTTTYSNVEIASPLIWTAFDSPEHTQTSNHYAVYYKQTEGKDDVALLVKYTVSTPQWFIFSSDQLTGPSIFQNNLTFNFNGTKLSEDYTTAFSSITVIGPQNGALFGGTKDIIFIDGVFLMTDGKNIYHTEFSNEERVDPLAFASAEFLPDEITGLMLTQDNMAMVLGRNSCEYFIPNAASDFGFVRSQGLATKSGLIAVHAKVEMKGSYFALGGYKEESVSVNIIAPGQTQSISTREIEKVLDTYTESEFAQARIDAVSNDGSDFLYIALARDTLLYNHTLAKSSGLNNAWTILKSSTGYTNVPWSGISPVFDPRISKFVFGDRFTTDIGILDNTVSTLYGKKQEWELYSPFIEMRGATVWGLRINIISGFTTKEDQVFISQTIDGETYSMEKISSYGGPQERAKQLLWRRLGFVKDYVGYKFRGIFSGRVAMGILEVGDKDGDI